MRSIISITFLLGLITPVLPQNQEADSLKNVLIYSEEDTSKVNVLNRLAYLMYRVEPQEGLEYALESIALSSQLGFEKGLARAYNSLGACYWNQSELDSALKYYNKSYELNKVLGSARGMTGALSNMAIIYNERGDYVNAINTYTQALEVMRAEGLDSYVAITSNNLGLVFLKIGNYPEALKYFNEAIKIGEPLGMTNLTGPAWINVGNIQSNMNDLELELEAKKRALKIGQESGDRFVLAMAYNNLGNVFLKRDIYDSALTYFQNALEINTKMGRKTSIALNLSNIGVTHREMGQLEKSLDFLEQGLVIAKETKHLKRIARISYQLGQTTKELYGCEAAIPYLKEGYNTAKGDENHPDLRDLSKTLYDCYLSLGEYKSAVNYLSTYAAAKDSILNEENIREISKVSAQYKYENQIDTKNNEIKLLESKKQVADLRITLLLIGVILIAITAFFISRMMIMRRERKKKELEAINKFRGEMTGMIAHDLKSPLSVIMNANESTSTKQMAGQMLQLINNMLDVHKFESTKVSLKLNQCFLRKLLDEAITQVRFLLEEKDLELRIETTEDYIVLVDQTIIIRVLVNLLTNAIKYSPFNEIVKISVLSKSDTIQVSVSNKGKGIDKENMDIIFQSFGQLDPKDSGGIGSTGLGLTFVKLALQAHGSDIHVESESALGTTFSFEIPFVSTTEALKESLADQSFEFSEKLKNMLRGKLALLRKLNLHQVGDIEKELADLKGQDKETDEWVEQLLNSVYAGNKEKYKTLLDELE